MDDEWVPHLPTTLSEFHERKWGPLLAAIFAGDEGEANRLLTSSKASKADLDEAVISASASLDSCFLKQLLKAGADPNARTTTGHTALIEAAQGGELENVKALLAAGADMTTQTTQGESALSLAQYSNRNEVVRLLKNEQLQ